MPGREQHMLPANMEPKREYVCINSNCLMYMEIDRTYVCRCPLCGQERISLGLNFESLGGQND